jgi:hypothetical protein
MSSWRIKSVLVALGVCWLAGGASALAPKHLQGLGDEICGPRPDGQKCEKVDCPTRQEKCRPISVVCDEDGCRITECDCMRPGQCRLRLPDSDEIDIDDVHCEGLCPQQDDCQEVRTPLDGGGVRIECRCVPELECEPDPTGLRCNDSDCPGDDRECTPTKVTCGPNGCRVVECDCESEDGCHPEVTATGAVCVGDCPPGLECREIRTPVPDGGFSLECDCAPIPQCAPDPTGFGCNNVTCPNSTLSCRPTRVFCIPGAPCRVIDCDCVGNRCHVEITAAAGPVCVGECPEGTECVRRVQPVGAGSIISCECEEVEQECEPNPTGTGCNDVECDDDDEECLPERVICTPNGCRVLSCECGDPDRCHVEMTTGVLGAICVGECPDGTECVRRAQTTPNGTIVRCECEEIEEDCGPNSTGTGCRDVECANDDEECRPIAAFCPTTGPCRVTNCDCTDDGCHLEITASAGAICVGECPTGTECVRREIVTVNGFFVRCECEPVQEPCHREVDANGNIVCVGDCPDNTQCRRVEIINPDGTVTIDCECEPIQQFCHPEVDPETGEIDCLGGCPPGLECRRFEAGGAVTCGCFPPQPCHRELVDGDFVCVGGCPRGTECTIHEIPSPDGSVITECLCLPPDEPCHAEVIPGTNLIACVGSCPDDGQECRRVEEGGTVTCECLPVDEPCHQDVDDNGNVICTGLCPPGESCELNVIVDPDGGTTTIECVCEPIEPFCHPEIDPVTNETICVGGCPAGSGLECRRFEFSGGVTCACAPPDPCHREMDNGGNVTCVGTCPTTGQECQEFVVNGQVTCDCGPIGCHREANPSGTESCVGFCPAGEQCREVVRTGDDGVPFLDCQCEPGPTCAPNATGTGCNGQLCPGVTFPCIPTLAFCPTTGPCRVVDCDCRMPNPCHVEVNSVGEAACRGPCVDNGVCSEIRVDGDGGQFLSCECRLQGP